MKLAIKLGTLGGFPNPPALVRSRPSRLAPHALNISFLCLSIALLVSVSAQAETLTLDQCVAIALKDNPDNAIAAIEIEAASARRKSTRGAWGPRLKLDLSAQRWDKALGLSFFTPLMLACTNCAWNQDPTATMTTPDGQTVHIPTQDQLQANMEVRAQHTFSFGVTLAQPLTSLWTVREANELAKLGVDVAEIKRKASRRDVAYQVTEAYYRLLQAKRMAEVAGKSVEQVTSQVQRARTFFEQGMVARNDVLRAELGLAASQQRLIQARGGVTLARGRLATLMGRAPDSDIDAAALDGAPAVTPPVPAAQAEQQAVASRLELKEIGVQGDMAQASVRMARSKMLPQVNALANYTHAEGSAFQLKDSWFLGGMASWDIWEGGGTYYGIDEAKARVAQTTSARRKAEDMIRLDVRSAHVGVTTAMEALAVAASAVVSAEENFRIEQKRYESTSNTSFDVLDAETQLTTARGQHQAAIYELLIAQSNLARAMGEIPSAAKSAP
jgi:outer membrane protein